MKAINDGGPAFPVSTRADAEIAGNYGHQDGNTTWQYGGITMRDYFAAQAIPGVLHMVATGQHELGVVRPIGVAGIAASAYEIADAMIAARSGKVDAALALRESGES